MTKSLRYLAFKSLKNSLKNILKKPLKTIGITVAVIYFMFLPIILKEPVSLLGLDNKYGFIVFASVVTVYLRLPSTLSYFKRKGLAFTQADVNLILTTPTSPKQGIIYGLIKNIGLEIIMAIVVFVAAIVVFKIPAILILIYLLVNETFSKVGSYSLAIIMYGSETISKKQKNIIKWTIYTILITFTAAVIYFVVFKSIKQGFDISYLLSLVSHPLVLMIPIFGWELGWLNLIILGPSTINIISTILFFLSTAIITYAAYRMKSTGEYYEDALSFSENLAYIESKGNDITFSEAFGNKRKYYDYKGSLKGKFSRVIFSKQLIERRRSKKFFFSFQDLSFLIIGIGIAILSIFVDDLLTANNFFIVMCGISIYASVFFNPLPTWKEDFENYQIFIMPDTFVKKLFNATLLEHLISFIRAIIITLPAGIIIRASVLDIIFAIIAQTLLKAMITYVSIFVQEVIGSRIGDIIASFLNVFTTLISLVPVILVIVFNNYLGNVISFIIISVYSLAIMYLFLFLSAKSLSNIEAVKM